MSARKHTVRDYLIVALVARGATRIETKSAKYAAFCLTEPNGDHRFYFVGRNGALRWSNHSECNHSVSLTGTGWFYTALVDQGRALLDGTP